MTPDNNAPDPGNSGAVSLAPKEVLDAIREHRRWFRGLGIALVIAGIVAVLFPLVASIATKVMFGWIMLLAGAATLWHAFQTRDWTSTLWNAAVGVLSLTVGVYLAFFPLTGLVGITVILGLTFAVQGVFEVLIGFQNQERKGWGWLVASGAISVLLGAMLLFGLPGTAVWALGVLVGIHFITSGASLLALVRAV